MFVATDVIAFFPVLPLLYGYGPPITLTVIGVYVAEVFPFAVILNVIVPKSAFDFIDPFGGRL